MYEINWSVGLRGVYPNQTLGFVHIDDVVAAHLMAMEEPKASGRLVCSSTVAHWSQIIHMLRAKYPSYPYENKWGSYSWTIMWNQNSLKELNCKKS